MVAIDHVAFGAVRLASASDGLRRLGFAPTARGHCRWSTAAGPVAAASCSVVFDRCYLDVIEHDDARWRAHVASSSLYGCGAAPSGVVLRAHSVEDVAQRCAARGIGCFAPYDITRTFDDRPEQVLRYRLVALDRRAAGGLPLAFIHDHDPAGMRRSEWLSHPNGATDLARVTIRVPERDPARCALDAISSAVSNEPGATTDAAGPILDLVEDPDDVYLDAVAALLPNSDRAALLALTFWSDLDATVDALQRSGMRWIDLPGGRIGITPQEGIGCGIVFARRFDVGSG